MSKASGIGIGVGLIPFVIQVSSTTSTTINGVTTVHTRDWIALACGGAAILLGIVGAVGASREKNRTGIIVALVAAAIGAFQIARGVGAFDRVSESAPGPQIPHVPVSHTQAASNASETCRDGSACFDEGQQRSRDNDARGATIAYSRACDLGDGRGCDEAGNSIGGADGTKLFDRGCQLGNATACMDFAVELIEGKSTAVDLPRAQKLLTQACDANLGEGCRNLGVMFQDGLGVPADQRKASELFERACSLRDAKGCDGEAERQYGGKYLRKDLKRAASYSARACDIAPKYYFNMGVLLEHGEGVSKDEAAARASYEKACGDNELNACVNLGLLLRAGKGGPKDIERGKQLLQRACDGGISLGCDDLR